MANSWTFTQVDGRGGYKSLELTGWNAPFGRPRKGPVITETIISRIQTTRYPGASGQTRHAFGINWEQTEMSGRWMTKMQPDGSTANDIANDWIDFVKDERTCRIAWGYIASWTGYIEKLELQRESPDEIAWKMTIQIDRRDDVQVRNAPPAIKPASDSITAALSQLIVLNEAQKPIEDDISPDFLDALDNLAAQLNEPAALMAKLAGRYGDLEKATFNTIQHFRGAIADMQTALVTFRNEVVGTGVDDAFIIRTAETDVQWALYQANVDNQVALILDELGLLDKKAQLAENQSPSKFVTAVPGDTWEAISIRATGGTDKVGIIRQMNGIKYGTAPTAGETYFVP